MYFNTPICSFLQYKEKTEISPSMFGYSYLESMLALWIYILILWINASYKVKFYGIENLVHHHKKNNYVNWSPHVGTWNCKVSFGWRIDRIGAVPALLSSK